MVQTYPEKAAPRQTQTNATPSPEEIRFLGFTDPHLEALYRKYIIRVRRGCTGRLAQFAFAFDCYAILLSGLYLSSRLLPCLIVFSICAVASLSAAVVLYLRPIFAVGRIGPFLLWSWLFGKLLLFIALSQDTVAVDNQLAWHLTFVYCAWVLMPLTPGRCLILALTQCLIYTITIVLLSATSQLFSSYASHYGNMVGSIVILQIVVFFLGFLRLRYMDKELRQSFLQTKDSLSINLELEQGSKQQEELLMSVLPRHVAEEMIKDIGNEEIGQFRKIYMNRHENVSILFADIVGFTALSSTVTPRQLVRILNDLFANFDTLASKYHQLRIKILGDCYYCISGCPDPRSDHAVLCVHMGLMMVEAISEVREKTKTGVNMRVGIHTGAVLGGVLGQVRWQYDVLGKEVTLANNFESGGLPGRVHLSEKTASFLDGEFELEPGGGDGRSDVIRMAGLKSFLIKRVIKPYPDGTLDGNAPSVTKEELANENSAEQPTAVPHTSVEESNELQKSKEVNDRLMQALMEREEKTSMSQKLNWVTLFFKEKELEQEYNTTRPILSRIGFLSFGIILISNLIVKICLLEWSLVTILPAIIGGLIIISFGILIAAFDFPKISPSNILKMSRAIDRSMALRGCLFVVAILILVLSNAASVLSCSMVSTMVDNTTASQPVHSTICQHPSFFIHIATNVSIGVTLIARLSYLTKACFLLIIHLFYCLFPFFLLNKEFDEYDERVPHSLMPLSMKTSVVAMFAFLFIVLVLVSRQLDRLARKLFYYQHELGEMRLQINALRTKNEALIYNILPAHVASVFIGSQKRDNDLFSQGHDDIGVMFASCPNFNDFYNEDAVNNNGLECIRFMNEILSDYDDLLKDPRFATITKIKSIGSTYMAASGINDDKHSNNKKDHTEKWQHLADMVEFGLAMKEALRKINSQSFNNFNLRIGINQGPVIAGVIGARKPHYDIWGNSVNVASRMESTGQVGKIQVVEDTMYILAEFGYQFEQRGLVSVKGKGQLMTYFLKGKTVSSTSNLPNQAL